MSAHTPGPWPMGEYDAQLGYDCMYGGIRVGPVVLDGYEYGQKACDFSNDNPPDGMLSDARLIAAAPDLLAALGACLEHMEYSTSQGAEAYGAAVRAHDKATQP